MFGNFSQNIIKAQTYLAKVQNSITIQGISEDLHQKELEAHANLETHIIQQEIFLKENIRIRWLEVGDRNTTFFII